MNIDRLIEGHFADGFDAAQEAELRAALRDSEAHRAAYDRYAELLRTLANQEPTARETAALWSRLEDALDAPAAAVAEAPTRAARRRSWLQWVPAAVAVALVAGMVYFALQGPPTPNRTIKGGAGKDLLDTSVSFEIYAIRALAGGGFGAPRLVPPAGTLTLRDLIQFRYRSESDRFRHLYLGALRPASGPSAIAKTARLYYPRPDSETSIAISASSSPRAVARSIRLAQRHRAGQLELVALFCAEPQPRARVLAALEAVARGEANAFATLAGACALRRQVYTVTSGGPPPIETPATEPARR